MAARCFSSSFPPLHLCTRHESTPRRAISSAQFQKLRTVSFSYHSGRRHGRMLDVVRAVDEGNGDGGADESNKGRQLWRTELLSNEFESLDDEVSQSATLERDIERLSKKEEVERLLNQTDISKDPTIDQKGDGIKDIVDKVLVADFFFILFILAWLVAGLAERAALESTSLIDSWLPLWPSVFQPALGVFMAGAIISALTKKKE